MSNTNAQTSNTQQSTMQNTTQSTTQSTTQNTTQANKLWNYIPSLPIQVSPYFRKPFSLKNSLKWMFSSWFPVSDRLIVLCLALLSWAFFHPEITQTKEFAFAWIAQIYLRNLILLLLVAGGLYCYFYIWRKQGDALRFDEKPVVKSRTPFTFGTQILDNMFWSIASGVTIWTVYEALIMWSMANGYVPMLDSVNDWPWVILLIFLVPIWETFYFFMIHKLIHWPPLYKRVHHLHHRNNNVTPWSGFSMHPVEHALFMGSVLIHFVVPVSPLVLLFHLQYYALTAASTHTGYRGIKIGKDFVFPLGTFHHQLHHRFYECNYGGLEIPMDKWTDNFHDGTDESQTAFLQRQRKKAKTLREKKEKAGV